VADAECESKVASGALATFRAGLTRDPVLIITRALRSIAATCEVIEDVAPRIPNGTPSAEWFEHLRTITATLRKFRDQLGRLQAQGEARADTR